MYRNIQEVWALLFKLNDQDIFVIVCDPLEGVGVNDKNSLGWPKTFCRRPLYYLTIFLVEIFGFSIRKLSMFAHIFFR